MKAVPRFARNMLSIALIGLAMSIQFIMNREGCGDRPEDFRIFYYTLGIAAGLSLAFSLLQHKLLPPRKFNYITWTLIRYFLAYTFASYGAAKVFDLQFSGSMAQLDETLINMSPMGLAWNFFGYSYTYQAFVGWGQILAAALLCFRRTAIVGAIALLPIIGNIVMVNFAYEVCVKLNSCIYLVMTFYVLLYDYRRLFATFFTDAEVPARNYPLIFQNLKVRRGFRIFGLLLTAFVLAYPVWEIIQLKKKYGIGEKTVVSGAWHVNQFQVSTADTSSALPAWKKIYFESRDRGSIRTDDKLQYFQYQLDTSTRTITLEFPVNEKKMSGEYRFEKGGLTIEGLYETDSIKVELNLLKNYSRR